LTEKYFAIIFVEYFLSSQGLKKLVFDRDIRYNSFAYQDT